MRRGRPRTFNPDQALETAMLLFWRHGYEGTSLAALTAAIGVNTPSLYAAFGSKDQLFHKVLTRYLQNPASYLPNALKEPTARRAVEKLFRGAIHMVAHARHPDGCLLVQGALAAGPAAAAVRRQLAETRRHAQLALQRRLERAVTEGDLPAHARPVKLARYLITVLWGMSVQAAGGATRAELRDIAAMALQALPPGR
ncbi:MAG TPA: TetR/AcrR family transcriptional regulator [Phycisphaerae bacterium]|nr:TetR/AcrR family transcriptional regulator [Phycisphaerae bacterium]